MNPLETYLREIHEIRSSGEATAETSYYGPLRNLLNDIGKSLKPKVRCIINIKNRGAGLPDGGLFTPDQFQKPTEAEPLPGQIPARGVIEVKSTSEDAWLTAAGEQVSRYWGKYRQVLVTNLRDFLLVGQDAEGRPVKLESYRLAESEVDFWREAIHPRRLATAHGERFTEYLKRVMLQAAPLAAPKDVAWFLASYARDAKARIEGADLPALQVLRAALEEALGLKFEGDKGEHFFRSTLVQTIFYGVFSAWVLWCKKYSPTDRQSRFRWREAVWYLHVPMIRALFEQLATPAKLGSLGLVEVLDWTETALNRVDRAAFFASFEEGHAVQYFYEPFLEAFDPELRKDLGVWYTPPEIVQYMVARVDRVLREELDLPDGLADPNVYILDPCCGTGAFLVEVLKRITETLREKGADALVGHDVKRAVLSRVFGFEILPAPFVVAHLQVGLYLQAIKAPLTDDKERAGVYLTNALTGWEPPQGPKKQLVFPEMEAERDAAEEVKRDKPILVILGNPPYNAFAGVSAEAEKSLVEPYKEGLVSRWGIKKFNLDDLYVRFFGLAERRIAGMTKKGVVSFISNFSYLGDPSFVVLRRRFLSEFDALWFDCLNGDSRETGKLTPDGRPDPSVFSTEYNREGIRVGTAVCLMVRREPRREAPTIRFRHFWGVTKRADLLESLKAPDFEAEYQQTLPEESSRFSFRPLTVAGHYLEWPKLVELCEEQPISGLQEMRHNALIDIEKDLLGKRVRMYYDHKVDWDSLKLLGTGFTQVAGGFEPKSCREQVQKFESFDAQRIMRYALYPFDLRWCYLTFAPCLWNRPRPELVAQKWPGNKFIITRMMAERPKENIAITITSELPDYHLLRPNAIAIPIRLKNSPKQNNANNGQNHLFEETATYEITKANLSSTARTYLAALGITDPDADADTAGMIWIHALAVGYAPAYLAENADGIRQDWPRVPLPDTAGALQASARLGREIAALLDQETPVAGVTTGNLRPEIKSMAVVSRVGGGSLNPDAGDLALTAGWGHSGKGGVTMPGKGKAIKRDYTPEELADIRDGTTALGLTVDTALEHLGQATFDIYLNDVAYWRNVPEKVWNYYIGGYQVIKKWLSYREQPLLGRPLTPDEAREVTHTARRLAAIVLLEPGMNANYQLIKARAYAWPRHPG
ncbi:MAG: type ISP restriction/modification enzyme [Thermodesulfobacteriota bacterium]